MSLVPRGIKSNHLSLSLTAPALPPPRRAAPRSAWQAGETPLSQPLERVEELIDDNVLQPDVLLVEPGEYGYEPNKDDYDY